MQKIMTLAGVSLALSIGSMSPVGAATSPFGATLAGVQGAGRTPLTELVQSSTQTVEVSNLPANVGLYGLHCALPADTRQAPTLCDESADALVYLPAAAADRPSVQLPIRVHAEFTGINPNPQSQPSAAVPVDCRVTACAVYLLGAGRESANPAYIRVWPTKFSPLTRKRKADSLQLSVGGKVVAPSNSKRPPVIGGTPVSIGVKTASGLIPTITGTNCSVKDGILTPLTSTGTCELRISTTGGNFFRPLQATQLLRIGTPRA